MVDKEENIILIYQFDIDQQFVILTGFDSVIYGMLKHPILFVPLKVQLVSKDFYLMTYPKIGCKI